MSAEGNPDWVRLRPRVRGCLLGGALGDALGAGIEFLSLPAIRARYGAAGPAGPIEAYGRRGAVTDDTQMSLFTAEGLIRARVRSRERGAGWPPAVVWEAYRRWLQTQGELWHPDDGVPRPAGQPRPDGWLFGQHFLHARRAPGHTCLSALAAGRPGDPAAPINDSKGCGGVMRAAPAGLLPLAEGGVWGGDDEDLTGIFRLGCELAALTHGHPSGFLPAGVLAATVHGLARGRPLAAALDAATAELRRWPGHGETLVALEAARELATAGPVSAERVESLGRGWTGEEALAIAVCAALAVPGDARAALLIAACHGGDSDSTAAICGNLVGTAYGDAALPPEWLAVLEGRAAIEELADDFAAEICGLPAAAAWGEKYPGW